MNGHRWLRLRASISRVRWILAALALWLGAAWLGFRYGSGLTRGEALLCALYLEVHPGLFAQGYAFWGQSLLFGVLVALLVRESLENYAERCRHMAKLVTDHTIIVGYTHLGARLVDHCVKHGLPFVLIERNRELVDDLLRKGEPVLVDDARTRDALPAANIRGAKRLIIASNNIETALLVTKHAREANRDCRIAARCPDDELVEVLEHLGANHVYSASAAAFQSLASVLKD